MWRWVLAGVLVSQVLTSPESDIQARCPDLVEAAQAQGPQTAAWQALKDWQRLEEIGASFSSNSAVGELCMRLGFLEQLLGRSLMDLVNTCPSLTSLQLETAANVSLRLGDFRRAQVLLQLGAPFRLSALSRVLFHSERSRAEKDAEAAISKRFHASLQALRPFGPQLRPWQHHRINSNTSRLHVQVRSLCDTGGGNFNSTAAPAAEANHWAWAERHGYDYAMLLESPLPGLEPQYSKVHIAREAISGSAGPVPDWFLWLDCDALVMNRSISIEMLLETYEAWDADFIVAEEPSGINTGTFLLRGSASARRLMEVASSSPWKMVWDQTMFLNGMVAQSDLFARKACTTATVTSSAAAPGDGVGAGDSDGDDRLPAPRFTWPPSIRTLHQAAMNLYSAGSAREWGATAWEEGDFVIHFAGCPLSEPVCWQRFEGAVAWAEKFGG